MMIYTIEDDDGIISLLNVSKYKTFVDRDWNYDLLKNHFVDQMNLNTIIIWQTNNIGGGTWKVKITEESNNIACSEFEKSIEVSDNKLYFANYTDLTMAAQFDDYKLPFDASKDLFYELQNGVYKAKISRLFDPDYDFNDEDIAFEISLKKDNGTTKSSVNDLYWSTI